MHNDGNALQGNLFQFFVMQVRHCQYLNYLHLRSKILAFALYQTDYS